MLTVTENTTQQINAALFEQDQNVKTKLSTVSGVVSAVYGACEWIFNKLKESLARVATTGSYNDLTDKPTIVDTVAQNVPNAVSSNAVYGALTNQIIHRRYNGVTGSDGAHAWTIGIAITGYKPVLYDIVGGNSTQVLIQAETFVDNALQGFCNIGNYNFSVDVLYIKNS